MHRAGRALKTVYSANAGRSWHVDCSLSSCGASSARRSKGESVMLQWAIMLFIIAIIAAILGFGGIAGSAAALAKILFFVFLVLAIASFAFGRRAI
jgi:uncharacterized membrane protein YtjA (UPF0391 family)